MAMSAPFVLLNHQHNYHKNDTINKNHDRQLNIRKYTPLFLVSKNDIFFYLSKTIEI